MEICTVGGYGEVGKNMLAVKIGDEVVILDMGLNLEPYIAYTDDNELPDMSAFALTAIGAVPNLKAIDDWRKKVIAIAPTHAHLDHIGAIPYLAKKFDSQIICTKFTGEVIKAICNKDAIKIKNKMKILDVNSTLKLSENVTLEFINMTHSIPETVAIALHTSEGSIVYATDFKFDETPVLGKKSNKRRLKEIGQKGVKLLVVDSLRSHSGMKTPSEMVARAMLKDVLLETETGKGALIVTTFSSHIARLKSIVEFADLIHRKPIFVGRSLARYVEACENAGIVNFSKNIEICKYRKNVERRLKSISQEKHKYLVVCTGHQGEPKAILPRIAEGDIEFPLGKDDRVIFSCTIIPSEQNRENRAELESKLKRRGVIITKDVHVSGHPGSDDLEELFNLLKPEIIVPCHGGEKFTSGVKDILEKDYKDIKCVIMSDGKRFEL